MLNWNDLRNLHVVKQTKKIIYKWWKIETLIINQSANHSFPDDLIRQNSFKNPIISDLFEQDLFCKSFFDVLQLIHKQKNTSANSFYEKWPETGLNIFVAPIDDSTQTTGFVVACGFLSSPETDKNESIKKQWLNLNLIKKPNKITIENIPLIHSKEKTFFMDLIELIAKEISSVQSEFINKKEQLTGIYSSHNLSYGNMVGKSKVMHQLYNLLDKIKLSENTILIQGENGTGKELIAKSIHHNSVRKNKSFIAQNCSAFNDNLLESELFGHVKGAFTGAHVDKKGLFEVADGGTLFLDEIGDTSPAMQVKLLRVLQEGVFFPVGSTELKKVDARIISATNKNLKQMVEEGNFREDLYYRLNVINIRVPALREREGDIALLTDFFINQYSPKIKVLTKKALEKLNQYHWPGNVRELQNEIERLTIFTGNDTYIKEEFLSKKIRNKENQVQFVSFLNSNNSGKDMKRAIAQLERQMISQCLKEERWNKTRVAKKLGISRAALVSKVKDYKLEKRAFSSSNTLRKKTSIQ